MFIQIVEKVGLAGEKLLEFVREKLKLEQEKEEKRRKLEEEKDLRDSQQQLNGRRQDGLLNLVLFCLDVP